MADKQPIKQSLVDRVAAATRDSSLQPLATAWMSPSAPIPAIAPQAAGRQFDYQVGVNLLQRPRGNEPISFASMRALAENYDLLRLVIETRKDQVSKMRWNIQIKASGDTEDARCKELEEFFAFPDQEHNWETWIRPLLEDLFVLDAPTLYPRANLGGGLYALELMDGATIKRIIDEGGRTPLPPLPAYQQTLKGIPAVDYTREELIYMPRNVRTHKIYGYSPVEQIIMTVNIAMRRQVSQLEYYTSGNIPDSIIGVPDTWTPEQIARFQVLWDSLLEGDTGARRKAKFVPGGMNIHETRPNNLKDDYDEWLARVVCYAFSVEPTPFIKAVNRATASTAHEQALAEGLTPILNWIKNLVNLIIRQKFGYMDIEFMWQETDATDPLVKAQINQIYLVTKVLTPDEVRSDLGKDPLTAEQSALLNPPLPPQVVMGNGPPAPAKAGDAVPPEPKGAAAAKLAKVTPARLPIQPLNRDSRAVLVGRAAIKSLLVRLFAATVPDVIDQLQKALAQYTKADADVVTQILNDLDLQGWADAISEGDMVNIIQNVTSQGGVDALQQISMTDPNVLDQVNLKASEFAAQRAAELVTVEDTTRVMLRGLVSNAIDNGWSTDMLAQAISDATAFSDARADMIARTETAIANVEGSMIAYRESGMVQEKEWSLAQDNYCDICATNAAQGAIALDDTFDSGDDAPPAHPNCRCDVLPVLEEEAAKMIKSKRR